MGEANFYYFTCLKVFNVFISGDNEMARLSMFLLAALVICVNVNADVDDRFPSGPMMMNPHQSKPHTVSTSGTHGCIDCVIGPCHQCLCREALKRCSTGVANVLDIFNKAKNQYLVCEGSRITCHPCPKGLVWNCKKQVCDVTSDCPPIPEECSCECGLSKKTSMSYTMSTFTTTSVTTTANIDTSTTVSYHPINAPLPAPRSSNTNTKYDSNTVAECFKMSGGQKISFPCDQVEQMFAKASVSVSADSDQSYPGSTRNSTTVKTTSPCSGVTTTTTSACQGGSACPTMKITVAVSPCKSGMKMDTEVLNLDLMAFKRCLCDEAMKTCSRPSRSISYPKYEGKYLTCYRDGRVTTHVCPPGTWWNEDMEACSTIKKCSQDIPMVCLKYKF